MDWNEECNWGLLIISITAIIITGTIKGCNNDKAMTLKYIERGYEQKQRTGDAGFIWVKRTNERDDLVWCKELE